MRSDNMDFISLHLIPSLQAPVLSTRCSSPQQLLCAGPKPLPGQSVGNLSLVWANSTPRIVLIMEQQGPLWTQHGHVPWHCSVCEHPGSFRAPSGWEHFPGKSGWGSVAAWYLSCFVMSRSQCQELKGTWGAFRATSQRCGELDSLQDCTWVLHGKFSEVVSRVITVRHLFGVAEPHPFYFLLLSWWKLHKHIHIHTHLPCLVMQLSNSPYSAVLYWNSETFSEALFKNSLEKDTYINT